MESQHLVLAEDAEEPLTWEELYEQVNGVESRRSQAVRQLSKEAEALEMFEVWRGAAIDRLMDDLRCRAQARAREFRDRTGLTLEVTYPAGPHVTPLSGPEVRFLRLGLGNALVHIYTSHAPGSPTHIHLLPSRSASLRNNERLISEPGAFIVRRADDSYELRYQRSDPEGHPSQTMAVDELLFRAFRLLARWNSDD